MQQPRAIRRMNGEAESRAGLEPAVIGERTTSILSLQRPPGHPHLHLRTDGDEMDGPIQAQIWPILEIFFP